MPVHWTGGSPGKAQRSFVSVGRQDDLVLFRAEFPGGASAHRSQIDQAFASFFPHIEGSDFVCTVSLVYIEPKSQHFSNQGFFAGKGRTMEQGVSIFGFD